VNSVSKLIFISLLLIYTALIQGCSSLNKQNNASALSQLIVAEPLAVNFKSEIAIARLSEVIMRAEISAEQRAQLLYDRGVLYDSVGLRTLSRSDFTHALRLNPNFADAYNFLGIHFTQLQEFAQAYEKFDSALELAPQHEYAYLNRGIALYYGRRPSLAADDFTTFYQHQTNDPYRLLWLYLAEADIDVEKAKLSLQTRAQRINDKTWAKQIIELYLGNISQSSFINELTLGVTSNKALTDRLCEAYFYLGKYNQSLGMNNAAANFFKLSLSTNVYEFVEHRYAKLELDLMRKKQAKVN